MQWTADVAQGGWLRDQLEESWDGLHWLVPPGYPECVRVFHPFERERVLGRDWAEVEQGQLRGIEPVTEAGRLGRGGARVRDDDAPARAVAPVDPERVRVERVAH